MNRAEATAILNNRIANQNENPACLAEDWDFRQAAKFAVNYIEPHQGYHSSQFAGVVYGFGAFLTTRPGVMEVGESQCAASMADVCKEYLESFGITDEIQPDIPHFSHPVAPTP